MTTMQNFSDIEINANHSNVLLDQLLKLNNLKNDAALAKMLKIAPPSISKIRHGKLGVGAKLAIRIHETTNMGIHTIKRVLILGTI